MEIYYNNIMAELKVTVKGDFFFENNSLLQSDVVFDSESKGCNFSSATWCREKIIFNFFYKMISSEGLGVFSRFFGLK